MQVSYIFIALAPVFAFRLSDNVAVGFIDVVWVLLLAYTLRRTKAAIGHPTAIFGLLFLFSLLLTSAINFALNGASARDLVLLRIVFIFVPFFYAFSLQSDVDRLFNLTRLFIIFGGIAVVVGVILYHLGVQVRSNQQMLWLGSGEGPQARAGGILGNSSDFGLFASSWGSICGLLVLALKPRAKWKLFALISTVSTYAVWISASRGGLVHIFIAYAIGVPMMIKARGWIVILTIVILTVPLLILVLSSVSLVLPADVAFTLQRLDFLNISGDSRFYQSVRLENWLTLLNVGSENWALGIGYRGIPKTFENQGIFGDNSFISIFVEFGLITVSFYILFWVFLIKSSFRSVSTSLLGPAIMGIVLGELSHNFTLDTYKVWYSTPVTLFFLALLIKTSKAMPKNQPHYAGRNSR
jgi:hypothetical protein